jgi:hypothetical protein
MTSRRRASLGIGWGPVATGRGPLGDDAQGQDGAGVGDDVGPSEEVVSADGARGRGALVALAQVVDEQEGELEFAGQQALEAQ